MDTAGDLPWSRLYREAVDPEAFFGARNIRAMLAAVAAPPPLGSGADVDDVIAGACEWCTDRSLEYRPTPSDDQQYFAAAVLRESIPMASMLGCWGQGLSAPGVFEDAVQLRLMALLADDVGVGRPSSSRFDEYQALLKRQGLPQYAVPVREVWALSGVDDAMFALPAVLLRMSRRSDEFTPELLGINLVMRSIGLLPCWSGLRSASPGFIDWRRLDLRAHGEGARAPDPAGISRQIVAEYATRFGSAMPRLEQGAGWVLAALKVWDGALLVRARSAADPSSAMSALIRARARQASAYHADVELAGRNLSTWLREARLDPEPLLAAIAGSPLISPGDSARSRLVNGLISPSGPMFRIFSPEDLDTIRRWIDSLPAGPGPARTTIATAASRAVRLAPADGDDHLPGQVPGNIRQAYFLLQGRALPPAARSFALDYVRRWLSDARASVDRSDRSLPRQWPGAGLHPWLLDQHDRHARDFEERDRGELPSRESVVDGVLQLAPLTLIDGSWLQGFTDLSLASSRIGFPLFETYWDELGNGDPRLNHPRIYRAVLRQMGITLPPTGSKGFAEDHRFRDSSFRLPVYWLALGKSPTTFLPEILGMNLAMELSGVGGSYRSGREVLKHYGFSTQFVDIHNTIDNVSTGHSAWAADAIDTYLCDVLNRSGTVDPAAEWLRIRIGYESLEPLPRKVLRRTEYRFPRRRAESGDPAGAYQFPLHHQPVSIGV